MNVSKFKSGEHEQQYEYRSFLPAPINREWTLSNPQILTLLAWKIHDSCHKKSHRGSTLCYRSGVETLLRTTLEDPRWRQTVYRK